MTFSKPLLVALWLLAASGATKADQALPVAPELASGRSS